MSYQPIRRQQEQRQQQQRSQQQQQQRSRQQQAQRSSQQQQQRLMQQQSQRSAGNNKRAAKQMSDLMARTRLRRSNWRQQQDMRPQPREVSETFDQVLPSRRRRSKIALLNYVLLGALVVVMLVIGVILGYRVISARVGAASGSVAVGRLNARTGPGTSSPVVGKLHSGDAVKVSCANPNWARLASPYPGSYVYLSYLALEEDPKPC